MTNFIKLIIKGNENIVRTLLKNGASVDACDTEGRTALRAAVFSGHEHIVKLLIEYGADGKLKFRLIHLNLNLS